MDNIVAVLIVRCTHTGVYADGRPNNGSVTLYDLDEVTIQKNRTRYVPIPPGSTVDIPMSTRTFVSWHQGDICKFTMQGLLTSEIIFQLRDKGHCGGPAGTGQSLRPAVQNIERVGNVLRLVIPDNVIPSNLDSVGFLVGEPVEITGLTGAFRSLNGTYTISDAEPATGLAGVAAGSYLIEVPSVGPDIPAATLAGVNLCLTEGRVTAQFSSAGDVGGFGANVFGYVGGQFLPNAGGGGGSPLVIEDEGVAIELSTTLINFVGAGVTATSTGVGTVDVTIPGGSGGAPDDAEYLVLSADATLTNERVFTAGTGIAVLDGGAGGSFTVSVDAALAEILVNGNSTGGTDIIVSSGDVIVGQTDLVLNPGAGVSDNVIIDGLTWPSADGSANQALVTDGLGVLSFGNPTPGLTIQDEGVTFETAPTLFNFVGAGVTATSTGVGTVDITIPGGGGAPVDAEYVVLSLNGTLTNERVLTAGSGIAITDGGAGGNVTLTVDATLAEILANGNTTGGNDIVITTGDRVVGQTDLVLDPGAGVGDNVIIDGLTWPSSDGFSGDVLTTDGAGNLTFQEPPTAVLTWGNESVAGSTATRYLSPWWEDQIAPLVPVQWRVPRAGEIRNMRVRHNSPGGNGNTIVYTLRVNGVATALTVSIASTAADASDLVNTVSVLSGDLVDIEVTKAATIGGSGALDVVSSMEFAV